MVPFFVWRRRSVSTSADDLLGPTEPPRNPSPSDSNWGHCQKFVVNDADSRPHIKQRRIAEARGANGFQQALAHTLDQARQAAERFRGQGVDLWGYTTTQPGGVTRSEVLGRRYH